MPARIGLSTSSVYPESTAHGFAYAARLGYDAIEVMVGIDALSQQTAAVRQLSEHHGIPICAVHAPTLLLTQRVWGTEPWGKLERSAEMAQAEAELGAQAENAETLSPVVAETKAPPLGHSGTAEEEVSMDDVEKAKFAEALQAQQAALPVPIIEPYLFLGDAKSAHCLERLRAHGAFALRVAR